MQRRGGANGNRFPHPLQPRVRETRMHSHVAHVIRSRLAILPARIASCCRVGMDQLAGWGAWGRSLACLGLGGLEVYI